MQQGPQDRRVFPLSRCFHYENFKHYYAFGNSPAEDLLQSVVPSECRRPRILSLGCGDMRSVMFSIFKNFGFEGKNSDGFTGVDFVLNDRSAAVLARNILFLYLCIHMPTTGVGKREWIASMWSIWYNHELLQQHDAMLSSALTQLIQWSSTVQNWSTCPLGSVVQFSSPAMFAIVKKVWDQWHTRSMGKSVKEMKVARSTFQCYHMKRACVDYINQEDCLKVFTKQYLLFMLKSGSVLHSSETTTTMEREYLYYLTEGTVWAEGVLDIPISIPKTVVNPTLLERADGRYTLHYVLNPFTGFTQTFLHTPAEVGRTFGKQSSLLTQLPVADHHFHSNPLLANSVQQFSMWLEATAHLLKNSSSGKVRIMFYLDDSIDLCCSLLCHTEKYSESAGQFDAIYTSNLFDHLSPPALVLRALPLLKSNGTLFTATFKATPSTSMEYLKKMFGFSPEHYPAFLGIHCIGQDGIYSSVVNHEPCPFFPLSLSSHSVFPWRNVNSQSLVFDDIQKSPIVLNCLLRLCTKSCALEVGSVDTFLCVLYKFLQQFKFPPSHPFLNSLVSEIKSTHELKPHLMQLQTQSLLHGIHMHITLTEDDCPVCRGQPLDSYIQQCSVSFDIGSSSSNVLVDTNEAPTFAIYLGSNFGDHTVVTSIDVKSCGSTLELIFYLPIHCLSQYDTLWVESFQGVRGECVFRGTIDSLKSSSTKYVFLKDLVKPFSTEDHKHMRTLGSITKHVGDGCSFESVISMSEPCKTAVKVSKLNAKCLEANHLRLCCGSVTSTIVYPYVIDESSVHIKVSKKRSVISITVQRAVNEFYKEKPTYYIDPSNALILPRFQCEEHAIEFYCSILQLLPLNAPEHPLFNAKRSFVELFKHALKGKKHFTLSFPSKQITGGADVYTAVYVHDLRFSTVFSSPALDVSYCFLDTIPIHHLNEVSVMGKDLGAVQHIMVDDAEYTFLKQVFKCLFHR